MLYTVLLLATGEQQMSVCIHICVSLSAPIHTFRQQFDCTKPFMSTSMTSALRTTMLHITTTHDCSIYRLDNRACKNREQCDVLLIVSSKRALLVYFRMSAAASNKQQQHHHNDPIEAGAGAVATKGNHSYKYYLIALSHELCLFS
jgi:hypothetical protein